MIKELTSKLDYYIFIATALPVSNRLIIEQGVSEYHNFSIVVEHTKQFTSVQTKCLKVLWVNLVVGV